MSSTTLSTDVHPNKYVLDNLDLAGMNVYIGQAVLQYTNNKQLHYVKQKIFE